MTLTTHTHTKQRDSKRRSEILPRSQRWSLGAGLEGQPVWWREGHSPSFHAHLILLNNKQPRAYATQKENPFHFHSQAERAGAPPLLLKASWCQLVKTSPSFVACLVLLDCSGMIPQWSRSRRQATLASVRRAPPCPRVSILILLGLSSLFK